MRLRLRAILLFSLLPLLALLPACTTAANAPSEPRTRLGSIPFPGIFTLYATADPRHLGQHRYGPWWDKLDGPGETSRGIMYTCRAGFLDLSHLRDSIDWAKYIHDRALASLNALNNTTNSSTSFTFSCSDAKYEVQLRYPDWWLAAPPTEREALSREAAIRIGQRVAVIMATWHEIGTWYGQETIPGISEQNSAFTWDDGASHVVAAIVAGRALHSNDPWDIAVTRELDAALATLDAADGACESSAIRMVQDRWWRSGIAVRRDFSTGLDGTPKVPWVVPGLDCCPDPASLSSSFLTVADLRDIRGRDLTSLLHVRITPSRSILRKSLGTSDFTPEAVEGEPDILLALERVRAEVQQRFGPDADRP